MTIQNHQSHVNGQNYPPPPRSRRDIQNSMNSLMLQVCRTLELPDKHVRFLLAIQASIGHAEAGEIVSRSRMAIASHLRLGGTIESQKNAVSKWLSRHNALQHKCGRLLIEVTPGTPEQAPQFLDHLGPTVEAADLRRRQDPRWRASKDGKREATTEAVSWIVDQLPKAEPLPEKEPETLSLSEYVDRALADAKRFVEARAERIESDYFSPDEAVRLCREAAREIAKIGESLQKTRKARHWIAPELSETTTLLCGPVRRVPFLEPEETELDTETDEPQDFPASIPGAEMDDFEGGGVVADLPLVRDLSSLPATPNFEVCAELPPEKQASESIFAFKSQDFDYFFLRLENAEHVTLRSQIYPAFRALEALPEWLSEAERLRASLMLRPMNGSRPQEKMTPEERSADDADVRARAIHLDDIGFDTFEKLRHWAGFGFESSPGNYQAVVFVTANKETFLDIKRRLVKGIGSDAGASGCYRLPGSRNWKPGRDGVQVQLRHVEFGRVFTPDELERSGLLAPPEPTPTKPTPAPASSNGFKKFPDYEKCIASAPRKADQATPDWSAADLSFANIARDRDFTPVEIEAELTDLRNAIDGKPQRNPGYVRRTVSTAFRGVR